MKELDILLAAVNGAMAGRRPQPVADAACWQRVCALSRAHDLSLMVYEGLGGTELPSEITEAFLRQSAAAVSRFYSQEKAVCALAAALEAAHIDYMPLKGAVLRALYANPEWRVGRDVDVLVRANDFEKARRVAVGALSPIKVTEGGHDVGLELEGGVRIELHFSLFTGNERFGSLLADPFETACGEGHCYRMSPAALYAYHVAHMAKHFRGGGCGIRAFLDLFLLQKNMTAEELTAARALLVEARLTGFETVISRQSAVFFGGAEGDADTERLASFVAANHAFGSFRSQAANAVKRTNGKRKRTRGVLSRAFPPYRAMCYLYPVLRRWPILLPFCWLLRGLRMFSKKDRARFAAATGAMARVRDEDVKKLAEIYEYLQLEG